MKTRIRFFSILLIFFIVQDAASQEITYKGYVTYKHSKTTIAMGGGSDEGYNWNVDINQNYIVEGRFGVEYTGGISPVGVAMFQLTNINENIKFINTVSTEAKEEVISQSCFDDLMRFTRTETPGDSKTYKLNLNSEKTDPEKPSVSQGNLTLISPPSDNNKEPSDGKYTIMLIGNIKANVATALYNERMFPCLKEDNHTSSSNRNTVKMDFPIVIHVEKDFDSADVLVGESVVSDLHSTDCTGCLGSVARMVHGDVSCAFDETTKITWCLVKRTKKCEPVITYLKGDVKINGESVEQWGRGIEEGDIIETGSHSRIEIRTGNDEAIRLGSKSQLRWFDPCKPKKPKTNKEAFLAAMTLTRGQMYAIASRIVGKESTFEVKTRTAVTGVRGLLIPPPKTYYASTDPNFFLQEEPNLEKAELIEGYQYLSDKQTAYYIHFEDDVIKDISNLKGTVRITDSKGLSKVDLPEGATTNKWENGTTMSEIVILTK